MAETLTVQIRPTRGKRNAKRQRAGGFVPAVLYGHGKENLALSIPSDQVASALRHGSRIVDLTGAATEKALISEMQLDTFGHQVLHLDLTRVSEHQTIEIKLPIELRGSAPGVKAGGVIEHLLHEVEIVCPALRIPDRLQVNINELELEGTITLAAIVLPEGAKLLAEPDKVVVQCVHPREELEPEAAAAASVAEPEIIGRKPEEGAEEE